MSLRSLPTGAGRELAATPAEPPSHRGGRPQRRGHAGVRRPDRRRAPPGGRGNADGLGGSEERRADAQPRLVGGHHRDRRSDQPSLPPPWRTLWSPRRSGRAAHARAGRDAGAACMLRPGRAAMALLGAAFLCLLALMALSWTWGSNTIDVFTAVTGATGALLHGANPYSPIFSFRIPQYPGTWPGTSPTDPRPAAGSPRMVGRRRSRDVRGRAHAHVRRTVAAGATGEPSPRRAPRGGAGDRIAVQRGMVIRSWVEVYIVAGVVLWLALRAAHRRLAIVCLAVAMLIDPVTALLFLPAFIWSRRARFEWWSPPSYRRSSSCPSPSSPGLASSPTTSSASSSPSVPGPPPSP